MYPFTSVLQNSCHGKFHKTHWETNGVFLVKLHAAGLRVFLNRTRLAYHKESKYNLFICTQILLKQLITEASGKSFRSSCFQIFFKIAVLKIFAIFTGKHLCWSIFSGKLQI